MFGHDGAYGTDLSVNPTNGMVAVFMVRCPGLDQWAARDLFLEKSTLPDFEPCNIVHTGLSGLAIGG